MIFAYRKGCDNSTKVLSYGADAKVLGPEALRKEIIDEMKKAQSNYT